MVANCDGIHLRRWRKKIRAAHPPSNLFSSVQQQSVLISEQSCVLKEKVLAFAKMYLGEPRSAMLRRSNTSKKLCEITREKSGWFINRNLPQQTGCAQFHRRSSDLRGKKKHLKVLEPVERNTQVKTRTTKRLPFSPQWKKKEEKVKACLSRKRKEEKKKRNYIEIK